MRLSQLRKTEVNLFHSLSRNDLDNEVNLNMVLLAETLRNRSIHTNVV